MIKSCIFDLDGTLLYTIESITYYVNKAFQKHGVKAVTKEQILSIIGHGARDLIKKCLSFSLDGYTPEFFECVFADYKREYDTDPYYLTVAYDGVPELICELRRRGVKLGIVSNKQHSTVLAVAERYFSGQFDSVLGGIDGTPLKPDPAMLLNMAQTLGVEPCEIAYFGDMVSDIETAKNAGVKIKGGVGWGFRSGEILLSAGADRVFERPADILEVLG